MIACQPAIKPPVKLPDHYIDPADFASTIIQQTPGVAQGSRSSSEYTVPESPAQFPWGYQHGAGVPLNVTIPPPTLTKEDIKEAVRELLAEQPKPCPGYWEAYHRPGKLRCNECARLLDISELSERHQQLVLTLLNGLDHLRWS